MSPTPDRYLVADFAAPSLCGDRPRRAAPAEVRREIVALVPTDNLGAEIGGFLDCVADGSTPLVDGRAGLAALAVAERILAAIRLQENRMELSSQ